MLLQLRLCLHHLRSQKVVLHGSLGRPVSGLSATGGGDAGGEGAGHVVGGEDAAGGPLPSNAHDAAQLGGLCQVLQWKPWTRERLELPKEAGW